MRYAVAPVPVQRAIHRSYVSFPSVVRRQMRPTRVAALPDVSSSLVTPTEAAAEKVASWFESARKAQDKLISSYSEDELVLICDVFERFAKLWDQEREKIRQDQ